MQFLNLMSSGYMGAQQAKGLFAYKELLTGPLALLPRAS